MLLPRASRLEEIDEELTAALASADLRDIVGLVPDTWLTERETDAGPAATREAYTRYLTERLRAPRAFVEEARHAR